MDAVLLGALRSPVHIKGFDALQLQCVPSEASERTIEVTRRPVEEGVDLTDHARRSPDKVTFSVVLVSREDLELLELIAKRRQPLDVVGGLKVYEGFLLTNVRATRAAGDGEALSAELVFEEIRTAALQFVQAPPAETKRNAGRQPTKAVADDLAAKAAAAAGAAEAEAAVSGAGGGGGGGGESGGSDSGGSRSTLASLYPEALT